MEGDRRAGLARHLVFPRRARRRRRRSSTSASSSRSSRGGRRSSPSSRCAAAGRARSKPSPRPSRGELRGHSRREAAIVVPALLEADDDGQARAPSSTDGRLSGEKTFVDYGQCATHHLVRRATAGAPASSSSTRPRRGRRREPLRSSAALRCATVRYAGAPARAWAAAARREARRSARARWRRSPAAAWSRPST